MRQAAALRIAASVWWATAVLCCAAQNDAPAKKASVDGIVIDSLTRQPLRKTHVSLSSSNKSDAAASYGTTTGNGGEFSFEDLDPGKYVLSAEKIGYLGYPTRGYSGETDGRILHLELSAGQQLKSAELKLTPQGVISGRVVDSDGDPCEHCSVVILTYFWKNGKRVSEYLEGGDGDLDDRAVFRFTGLAAGKYYVYAKSENFFQGEHRAQPKQRLSPGPVLTYFGDTTVAEHATPIILAPGQQMSDLEIRLQNASVYSISGRVAGLETITLKDDGRWLPDSRHTFAWIRPKGSSDQLGDSTSSSVGKNGSFEISGAPPGTYELTISQAGGSATIARTVVDVGDHDVSGVLLQVMPLQSLSGKVEIDGDKSIDLSTTVLSCEDERGNSTANVKLKLDNSFTFVNLSPEKYTLHVWMEPKGTYLKAIAIQGVESHDGTVDLTSGNPLPVTIVLSTHGAKLQGRVETDSDHEDHSSWKVELIPDFTDHALFDFGNQTASVDQNGSFTFETIPPGSYKLYAFEKIAEEVWGNPDFLKQLQADSQTISLNADQSAHVTVPLISLRKSEQILGNLGLQ
ncbi:MAG: carboxypeptidase-like regulatory domain-containing protein [Bryobacteraceae bacterium]